MFKAYAASFIELWSHVINKRLCEVLNILSVSNNYNVHKIRRQFISMLFSITYEVDCILYEFYVINKKGFYILTYPFEYFHFYIFLLFKGFRVSYVMMVFCSKKWNWHRQWSA